MTDGNQFYIFLVCASCGIAGGVVYDMFYLLRTFVRVRAAEIAADVCFFAFFAGMYLFVSLLFGLPDLRFYMFLGCLIGLLLYLKSFHRIVAFFAEKVYNRVKDKKQKQKAEEKLCRIRKRRRKESQSEQR